MPFDEIQNKLTMLRYYRARWVDQDAKAEREPIWSVKGFHSEESLMAQHGCRRTIADLNANMLTGCDPNAKDFGAQVDAFLGANAEVAA
jgi:hypothetical protein